MATHEVQYCTHPVAFQQDLLKWSAEEASK